MWALSQISVVSFWQSRSQPAECQWMGRSHGEAAREGTTMDFVPAKKLGFGLMRLPQTDPTDGAAVDVEQVKKMVDLFMAKGFTYFDTAWMYNGFASERVAKEALVDRYPRESFTLAT